MQTGPPESSAHLEVLSAIDSLRADVEAIGELVEDNRAELKEQREAHRSHLKLTQDILGTVKDLSGTVKGLEGSNKEIVRRLDKIEADIEGLEHRLTDRLDSMDTVLQGTDNRVKGVEQTLEEKL